MKCNVIACSYENILLREILVLILKNNKKYFTFVFSWINIQESERSGMAVLDVTIPTGYWIQQQKLDSYVLSNRVRNLRRAKYMNQKVIFYFDYVRAEKNGKKVKR